MFAYPKQRNTAIMDDSDGEEATFTCRICFEEDCKPSELISPCRCKGTLKYVHQSCLHKWQSNVQKLGGKRDERATVCGVYRTAYTSLPPQAAMHAWYKVWTCLKALIAATCISLIALIALCFSGPPLLHLMLLLVLLVGSRSQSVLVLLVMLLGGVMASLYARGLRLVLRSEGDMRMGLALIRHGAPVDGLAAGSLLVAHQVALNGTFFAQSVVLLTEKSSRGAKGVVLTQPMESIDSQLWNHQLAERLSHSSPIRHYLGGPVGLPNQHGPATQTVVLHHMSLVPGAAAILRPPAAAAAADAVGMVQQQQQQQQQWVRGRTRLVDQQQQQQQQQRRGRQPQQWRWCPRWVNLCLLPDQQQQQQWRSTDIAATSARAPTLGSSARQGAAAAGGGSSGSSRDADALGLYQGGSLDDLLRAVLQHNSNTAAAAAAAGGGGGGLNSRGASLASKLRNWNREAVPTANLRQRHRSSSSSRGPQRQQQQQQATAADDVSTVKSAVRMYHGICSWSSGQLEGEIRAGAWGVLERAEVADVALTPPQLLWQQLVHSNRPRWW